MALVLLSGITGGLVLTAWSSARRGASSFPRFVDDAGPPNVIAGFCAPDATQAQITSDTGCPPYDPRSEAAVVEQLPRVQAVSRNSLVYGTYKVHGQALPGPISVMLDESQFKTSEGNPVVVKGRLADPTVATEVVVAEEGARLYDLRVGDALDFTPTPLHPGRPAARATVRAAHLKIVGIVRTRADLVAGFNVAAAEFSDSVPFAGPAFWKRYGSGAQSFGTTLIARVTGSSPRSFEATLRHRFPGRPFEFEVLTDPDLKTVSDAIGYETTAATAVAIVGAVAWLLLVGQTLVRRSADEHSDSPTFIALGMTRQQLVAAAVIRAIPVGVGSALIAGLMALVGSLKTPIGLAAMAEIGDGFWLDATVVSVGAIVISVVTVVGLCSAAVVGRAGARSASRRKTWRTMPLRSVSAAIGLRLASPRQRRRLPVRLASIVAALAVACAIAGLALVGSLHHLVGHGKGYGVTFDAVVTGKNDPYLSDDNVDQATRAVRDEREVSAAAGVKYDTVTVGRARVTVFGLWSIDGPDRPWSTITSGRRPMTTGEVAIGAKTMRTLGLGIGDHVDMKPPDSPSQRFRVVGRALFYDGFQVEPGEGALVNARWFGSDRERKPDQILVSSTARHPRWSSIERAGLSVLVPPPPAGVRNLRRVERAPSVVAAVVGLLALAALVHAVAVVARTERRQLAVLRAIGFTRRQLASTLATTALAIAGVGILVGIPLGLAAQRWIWRALERRIGFSSALRGDWVMSLVVLGLAVLCASLAGAISGWAASRRSVADALRAE